MRLIAVALLALSFAMTPLSAAKNKAARPSKPAQKKVRVHKPKHKVKSKARVN